MAEDNETTTTLSGVEGLDAHTEAPHEQAIYLCSADGTLLLLSREAAALSEVVTNVLKSGM